MNDDELDQAHLAYPTVDEIKELVKRWMNFHYLKYLQWPEDEWFDIGHFWSVNIWRINAKDGTFTPHITVYPLVPVHKEVHCDTSIGIRIL
jgi:hypothetical protein